jgi:hypothetical protein
MYLIRIILFGATGCECVRARILTDDESVLAQERNSGSSILLFFKLPLCYQPIVDLTVIQLARSRSTLRRT